MALKKTPANFLNRGQKSPVHKAPKFPDIKNRGSGLKLNPPKTGQQGLRTPIPRGIPAMFPIDQTAGRGRDRSKPPWTMIASLCGLVVVGIVITLLLAKDERRPNPSGIDFTRFQVQLLPRDGEYVIEPKRALVAQMEADLGPGLLGQQPLDRARTLFHWLQSIAPIDQEKLARYEQPHLRQVAIVTAAGTDNTGVTVDRALLLTGLARKTGLEADLIEVTTDIFGRSISHVCVGIKVDQKRVVLVDLAYHCFDIRHRNWRALSDDELHKYLVLQSA